MIDGLVEELSHGTVMGPHICEHVGDLLERRCRDVGSVSSMA